MQTDVQINSVRTGFTDAPFRTPLKFGDGQVDSVTYLTVEMDVETRSGKRGTGRGAILLSDLWAWPSKLPHTRRDALMRSMAERSARIFEGCNRCGHPLDIAMECKADVAKLPAQIEREEQLDEPVPMLAALNASSSFDAALHDGFGIANGIDSYAACGREFCGCDLSRWLGDEFKDRYACDFLWEDFEPRIPIWHLVGGLDKLTPAELAPDDPDDGLPVALTDWIARDGLRCFKIKLLGSDLAWDIDRVTSVDRVVHEHVDGEYWLSIDTNEKCESPDYVVELLTKLRERCPAAFDALMFVEQPTGRDLVKHAFDMRPLAGIKPVLVDEAVTDVAAFRRALELGWSGIALKTCKWHSASLLYVAMCEGAGVRYSVQDLTNPGLSFVHSAGLAARIRPLKGVEYNARQYIPALEPDVQQRHRGLFQVNGGIISTASLSRKGLGY